MADKNPFAGYAVPVEDEEEDNPFAGAAVPVEEDEKYSPLQRGIGFVTDNVSKGLQNLGNVVPSLINFGNKVGFYGYNQPIPEIPMVGDKLREQTKALGLSDVPEFQPKGTMQELGAMAIRGAASSPGGPLSMASGALGEIGAHYGEKVGGLPGAVAGGVAGALAGGSLAKTASKVGNMVKGGPTGRPVYDAMKAEGITPRLAGDSLTESLHRPTATQQTTAFLGQVPVLGSPISKAVDKTIEEIGRAKEGLLDRMGHGTADNVAFGQQVQKGVEDSLTRFNNTAEAAYKQLRGNTLPTEVFPWNNTKAALDSHTVGKITGGVESSKSLSSDFITRMKDAMGKDFQGGVSYQALDDIRKEVGKKLKQSPGISDVDQGELKNIWASVTEDMRGIARAKGFEPEFDTVNTWYSKTREQLNAQAKMLDMHAEKVYASATAGMKEGGSNLAELRTTLGPQAWPQVRSSVLERMGMMADAKGASHFDTNKFFTDYKNINEDAKRVLFPEPEYRQSLDNLATISEAMQTSSKAGNTSRTGAALTVFDQVAKLAVLPLQIAGGAAGAMTAGAGAVLPAAAQYGLSKMLASPALTKWLATPVAQFGGMDRALHQLNVITASQPELADDVTEFLEENRSAFEQPSETERAFGG